MWVEGSNGAVNLDHCVQIMLEKDGTDYRLGFWLSNGGYQQSAGIYYTRSEADAEISRIIDEQNHPLRVVRPGAEHDEHDPAGEGPRGP